MRLDELFTANAGLVTTAQLLSVINRRTLASHLEAGALVRVCHGVYALEPPDIPGRLAAIELATGKPIVAVHAPDSAAATPLRGYPLPRDFLEPRRLRDDRYGLAARDYAKLKKALHCDDDALRAIQKLITNLNQTTR